MTRGIMLHGLGEALRSLEALAPRMQKNALRGMVAKMAADVRDDARARVQKNTGNLRSNIVSKRRRGKRHVSRADVIVREEGTRYNKKNAFYWRFIEYGTRFKSARPFLRPALDKFEQNIDQIAARYLRGRIDKDLKARGLPPKRSLR